MATKRRPDWEPIGESVTVDKMIGFVAVTWPNGYRQSSVPVATSINGQSAPNGWAYALIPIITPDDDGPPQTS